MARASPARRSTIQAQGRAWDDRRHENDNGSIRRVLLEAIVNPTFGDRFSSEDSMTSFFEGAKA